ncbi:hypothetical protein [Mycobacterium seoulense]|nr:hypothetical protein [Mycobacterium seoulense]
MATKTAADELAVPLDLLLTSATKPFASRMLPDATWARFGANLASSPARWPAGSARSPASSAP